MLEIKFKSKSKDVRSLKKYDIAGIGACVMDTLISVTEFPREDVKSRADSIRQAGGGPVSTGMVAASKLGMNCTYIGTLSDDAAGRFLHDDFVKYKIDTSDIKVMSGFRSFTSYIILNAKNATRTCIADRGTLPALILNDKQKETIRQSRLLMIDGNEPDAAFEAAKIAHDNGACVLYDAGGLYAGVEKLLGVSDYIIPSEAFALWHTKETRITDAASRLYNTYRPKVVVITRGCMGGIIFDGMNYTEYPAFSVHAVDTNGAGDVFHGAFAAGLLRGYDYPSCCYFASAAAAIKCTSLGARESAPGFDEVMQFLHTKSICINP